MECGFRNVEFGMGKDGRPCAWPKWTEPQRTEDSRAYGVSSREFAERKTEESKLKIYSTRISRIEQIRYLFKRIL